MKPDWRDTVRVATDVAVLGLLTVVASLAVLTAGAALATASYAMHHFLVHDRWPGIRAAARVFRRALLPGALATAVVAGGVWLIAVDVAALSGGAVPGGAVLLGVTAVIAGLGAGYAALALVALGRNLAATAIGGRAPATGDRVSAAAGAGAGFGAAAGAGFGAAAGGAASGAVVGWRGALREAAAARPAAVAGATGVVALAALLAVLVHPILAACLVGYAIHALHVVTRRLAPAASPLSAQ
ncbi:hypothetical protein O7635_18735 [Asanoa sp. WMMD1127]|uniref:hypothetical protein n=1 Tax=Asanoa sp. WMMD1127 TaxID=3016107 RepID=UPI0024173A07|nr:hypothetical protein [Asanoa sp. WMMD1127]MDG4823897.1 hypothetical protein [Asanoa sp. WMMD1127]